MSDREWIVLFAGFMFGFILGIILTYWEQR